MSAAKLVLLALLAPFVGALLIPLFVAGRTCAKR